MKKNNIIQIKTKKAFHFWNSLNFLIVMMIIAMVILKFGDKTEIIEITKKSRLIYNWLAFTSGFTCIIYFICLRKKCGRLSGDFLWIVIGLWLIIRGVITHFSIKIFGLDAIPVGLYLIFNVICMLILISFLVINTMISINCFLKQKNNIDYLIIHGAKTGSMIVNNRTDTAALYMHDNKKVIAIASGGKGNDEEISEAEYISDRLKKSGIKANHIILEDKSTTTYENLLYSKKCMSKNASFSVVTDDYHILRARLLAKKVFGYMPEGLPVHSSRISLPHYILREYFSLIVNSLRGNLL